MWWLYWLHPILQQYFHNKHIPMSTSRMESPSKEREGGGEEEGERKERGEEGEGERRGGKKEGGSGGEGLFQVLVEFV